MSEDIVWCDYKPSMGEKPCKWYLDGDTCEPVSIGIKRGETKTFVHRYRKEDGSEHDIYWVDGVLPGVAYELLGQSTAGRA